MTSSLIARLQRQFPRLVLLLLAGAFALSLAELVLTHHTEDKQLIGVGASALGILFSLLGVVVRGKWKGLAIAGLLFVTFGGVMGTVEHREEALEHQQKAAGRPAEAEEEEEHGPPPLAPLSLAGLGLMGTLAVLARREEAAVEPADAQPLVGAVR